MEDVFTFHYCGLYCICSNTVRSDSDLHRSPFTRCNGALKGVSYIHTHFKGLLDCLSTKRSHGSLHESGNQAWFLWKWTLFGQICIQLWEGEGDLDSRGWEVPPCRAAPMRLCPSAHTHPRFPSFLSCSYICCSTELSPLNNRKRGRKKWFHHDFMWFPG